LINFAITPKIKTSTEIICRWILVDLFFPVHVFYETSEFSHRRYPIISSYSSRQISRSHNLWTRLTAFFWSNIECFLPCNCHSLHTLGYVEELVEHDDGASFSSFWRVLYTFFVDFSKYFYCSLDPCYRIIFWEDNFVSLLSGVSFGLVSLTSPNSSFAVQTLLTESFLEDFWIIKIEYSLL
jgi:hypothetical protein